MGSTITGGITLGPGVIMAPKPPFYFISTMVGSSESSTASVAVSNSGNIYADGQYSTSPSTYSPSFYSFKLNSLGEVVWQRRTGPTGFANSFYGEGCVLDSSENVYLIGYDLQAADLYWIKLDSNGNLQTQRILGSTNANISAKGYGAVIDSSNNLNIATETSNSGLALITLNKFDTSPGFFISTQTITDTGAVGRLICPTTSSQITIDSSDNIFLVGSGNLNSQNTTAYLSGYLFKILSNGTFSFQRYLSNPSGNALDLQFAAVALDSTGNIFVAGRRGATNIILAKYNSSGTLQFTKQLAAASIASSSGIAIDSSDNVYVLGLARDTGGGNVYTVVAKYNNAGTLQWQRKMSGGPNEVRGSNIKITNENSLLVGGNFNNTNSSIIFQLPLDGTKTGTYNVGSNTFTWEASSLTETSSSPVSGSSSYTIAFANAYFNRSLFGFHDNDVVSANNSVNTFT